jgi:hypothetical protein
MFKVYLFVMTNLLLGPEAAAFLVTGQAFCAQGHHTQGHHCGLEILQTDRNTKWNHLLAIIANFLFKSMTSNPKAFTKVLKNK